MNQIIAFAGRKQSGKTTCAEAVLKLWNDAFLTFTTGKIYNFADPLKKDICINILGMTYDQCYGSDDQKNELVDCWWDNKQLTAREVMQFIGTNVFRQMQNNVWADATIKKIQKENPSLAVIADCRFPNEVDTVRNAGGIVIKLMRNPYNSDHESEMALDKDRYDYSNFDLVVDNNTMSVSEQCNEITNFLKNKGILPL
jgi:chloramphenicol 3-O-phosphotransferase